MTTTLDPQQSADLRRDAETLAGGLPPLLAAAEHLAASVMLGDHGRRRVGQGDEFWQYRPSHAGDEMRMIDWRRSARAEDALFVREKEWQAAQSVMIWLDTGRSMEFASTKHLIEKGQAARRMALALCDPADPGRASVWDCLIRACRRERARCNCCGCTSVDGARPKRRRLHVRSAWRGTATVAGCDDLGFHGRSCRWSSRR